METLLATLRVGVFSFLYLPIEERNVISILDSIKHFGYSDSRSSCFTVSVGSMNRQVIESI